MVKLRKRVKKGFDVIVEYDGFEDDEHIRTKYECPNCGKKSTRCYEFYAWESEEGDELECEDDK